MNKSALDEQVLDDLDRPFAVTGRRAYLIGHMNGCFPDLGHHLPGEMGGLWAPPLKIADGVWFGLREQVARHDEEGPVTWMGAANCRRFTMKPGMAEREFALQIGGQEIVARQSLVVPEHEPGLLITVTLENRAPQPVKLALYWLTRFDIQGAWWSSWPDRSDEARLDGEHGAILAHDSLTTGWAAAMLANQRPIGGETGADLWANERTSSLDGNWGAQHGGIIANPDDLKGGGISGMLVYGIALGSGAQREVRCVLAGVQDGEERALQVGGDMLDHYEELLGEKTAALDKLRAGMVAVRSPRPDLDRVFAQQNLCLDMLTLDLPGVGPGIVAGLPGFAWFFGCDTCYSAPGLLVSGQGQTALDTLALLGEIGRAQEGRIPHEVTQTGRIFNPGNPVESGLFVTAAERAFRWSGDRAFLAQVYPVCRASIFDYLLGKCDPGRDLLPDGPGLLELSSAQHGKKLDVACSLYQGLHSLAYLAEAAGDEATAEASREWGPRVRRQIDLYFWAPEREEYLWRIAPDLSQHPDEPAHSYAVLEMGLLGAGDEARSGALFARVEGPEHSGLAGVIHPGTTDFVMPILNAIVALAEFRYGRPDKGLWYLEKLAALAGHYMPWAIPEFVGADSCFLQAWSSAAYNWLLVQGLLRLLPDPLSGTVRVQPQLPSGWDFFAVDNLPIWGGRYDLRVDRSGRGLRLTAHERAAGQGPLSFVVSEPSGTPAEFS